LAEYTSLADIGILCSTSAAAAVITARATMLRTKALISFLLGP
jgi:hypothetical protein